MLNQMWLNTFCTLVDVGHFTRTAEQLNMTQSGVSQHIKKLEQQLTKALLQREGKSFTLTETGKRLYEQGQQILLSFAELELSVKQDDKYEGVVKIASPGSIGLKLYPYLLNLQSEHRNLIIDYSFAPNTGIEKTLYKRNYDFGLMTELSKLDNISSQRIATEPIVLVTPANIENITWSALMKLGFISHPDGSYHAQLLLSQNFTEFEHANQFPHKGFSNQIGLICEPVSHGLGFTVLPLHAAQQFRSQDLIRIHFLPKPTYETLYLCVNNKSVQSERVKLVKSLITKFLN